MKKLLLSVWICCCACCSLCANSLTTFPFFDKLVTFGSTGAEQPTYTYADKDGNIYLVGSGIAPSFFAFPDGSTVTDKGNAWAYMIKYNSNLEYQWGKFVYGIKGAYTSGGLDLKGVAVDSNGDVYLAGRMRGSIEIDGQVLQPAETAGSDIFVYVFDKNGLFKYNKQFGSSAYDIANFIHIDKSDNIYLTGYLRANIDFGNGKIAQRVGSLQNAYVAKFNSAFECQWVNTLGSTQNIEAYAVKSDENGNTYFCGDMFGSLTFQGSSIAPPSDASITRDLYIAKILADGTPSWAKRIGYNATHNNSRGVALDVTPQGHATLVSSFISTSPIKFDGSAYEKATNGKIDMLFVRYDTNGNNMWAQTIGNAGDDYSYALASDSIGDLFIGGCIGGNASVDMNPLGSPQVVTARGDYGSFIAKYSGTNGFVQWAQNLGGLNADYASGLVLMPDHSVTLVGAFKTAAGQPINFDTETTASIVSPVAENQYDAYLAKYTPRYVVTSDVNLDQLPLYGVQIQDQGVTPQVALSHNVTDVTYQKQFAAYKWYSFALPFELEKIEAITPSGRMTLTITGQSIDNNAGDIEVKTRVGANWENVTTLLPNNGYIIRVADTYANVPIRFYSAHKAINMFAQENTTLQLSQGANVVANPFGSASTCSSIDPLQVIYGFDVTAQAFLPFHAYNVKPFESFIVKSKTAAPVGWNINSANEVLVQPALLVKLTSQTSIDELFVNFELNASTSLNTIYDHEKMFSFNSAFSQIYSIKDGQSLVVNTLPLQTDVPMRVDYKSTLPHTISVSESFKSQLVLKSGVNVIHEFKNGDYTITPEIGAIDYLLSFSGQTIDVVGSQMNTPYGVASDGMINLFNLTDAAAVTVFNTIGMQIQKVDVTSDTLALSLPSGVYVICVYNSNNPSIFKVIIP